MISSTSNTQIKHVIALTKKVKTRKEDGLFVLEGIKMFQELPKDRIHKVYVSESFLKQKEQESILKDLVYESVSDQVFKVMSDTQTPQGILVLARQYSYSLEDVIKHKGAAHLVILETIQDPGNLGTILRAGEGAGVTGFIMDSGTADIYNPKVIRSTMGSICRVPFVYVDHLAATLRTLKDSGVRLFASHLKAVHNYDQEDYTGSIGFLVGNEANGLSDEISSMADCYIKIPMEGKVESLNAAVASSILMYEAARQRRIIKDGSKF